MTCASPSLYTSPANSHVTENPHFLAHIQIPVMCCLGTLVLSRLAASFTHRILFTTCIQRGRCSDGRRGRRCRNDAGSYVGGRVGWALSSRDVFALISDARCYMSKPCTGKLLMQLRSRTDRLCAIPLSWRCSTSSFLALGLCVSPCVTCQWKHAKFFGTGPPYWMRRSLGFGPI